MKVVFSGFSPCIWRSMLGIILGHSAQSHSTRYLQPDDTYRSCKREPVVSEIAILAMISPSSLVSEFRSENIVASILVTQGLRSGIKPSWFCTSRGSAPIRVERVSYFVETLLYFSTTLPKLAQISTIVVRNKSGFRSLHSFQHCTLFGGFQICRVFQAAYAFESICR